MLILIGNGNGDFSDMLLIRQAYISRDAKWFWYWSISEQSAHRDVVQAVCGSKPVQFFFGEVFVNPQKPEVPRTTRQMRETNL
jgi:hypothetical protein